MRLRRRADRERVRETLREVGARSDLNERIANSYGEEIVRLRGQIRRALDALSGDANSAREILADALREKP